MHTLKQKSNANNKKVSTSNFWVLGFRCRHRHRRLIVFLCCVRCRSLSSNTPNSCLNRCEKFSTYIDFLLPLVFVCVCGARQEFENWNPSTLVQSNVIPFVHCTTQRNFSSEIFMFRPSFLFASQISNIHSCHIHIRADFIFSFPTSFLSSRFLYPKSVGYFQELRIRIQQTETQKAKLSWE